jgi:hypothetical protein
MEKSLQVLLTQYDVPYDNFLFFYLQNEGVDEWRMAIWRWRRRYIHLVVVFTASSFSSTVSLWHRLNNFNRLYKKSRRAYVGQEEASRRQLLNNFKDCKNLSKLRPTRRTRQESFTMEKKRDRTRMKRSRLLDKLIRCACQPQKKMCPSVSFMEMMTHKKTYLKSTPSKERRKCCSGTFWTPASQNVNVKR